MTVDKEYWESICVPYDEITNKSDIYARKSKLELRSLGLAKIKSINNLFFNTPDSDNINEIIESIADSPNFQEFIFIKEFLKGRRDMVNEFFKKPYFITFLDEVDFSVEFIPTLKAFLNNPENLQSALLYCEFKKRPLDEIFILSPKWEEQDTIRFNENIRGLRVKVARKYKGKRFIVVSNFDDGEFLYFVFQREKKQKITRAFERNVSLVGKSDLFLRISNDGGILEIKCGDGSLRDLVATHITTVCNKTLIYEKSKPSTFNLNNKIQNILTQLPETQTEDMLLIEQTHIKETIRPPRNCLKIGKKNGPDIRNTLLDLYNQGICNLEDKSNISSFHVNDGGRSIGIKLVEYDDGAFKFELTRGITDEKKLRLKQKIFDAWGIEIETLYSIPLSEENKKYLFDKFLEFDGRRQLSDEEKLFLQELINNKIIRSQIVEIWRCRDKPRDHIFRESHERCPVCDGPLFKQTEYLKSFVNFLGIKAFIRNKLRETFGTNNISEITRTYRKQPYSFFKISHEEFTFYVFIDTGRNIERVLNYSQKCFFPTIIVSIHKPLKGEIDTNIFSNLVLKELYFNNANSIIRNSVDALKNNYTSRINNASQISRNEIERILKKNVDYDENEFEDDIFNLMKFIFRTGQKWGKEKSGSTLPEAIIGYSTYYKKRKRGYKSGKISFIWDCKYRIVKGTFDFDREQIDKARRYIKQANDAPAIHRFSGHLNAYFNFSNSVNLTQYSNFSKAIYRIKTWKGAVVLFEPSALIKLYDYVRQDEESFHQKYYVFLMIFSKYIERPQENNFIHLTDQKIDEFLKEFESSNLPPRLDTEKLREYFELDELY